MIASGARALLDINLLVALFDADHVHHDRARTWLVQHAGAGWASCPLTQNGCARILSLPAYPNPVPIGQVLARLRQATAHPAHAFWPDDVSLLDPGVADAARIHGARQLTDAYLLALAVRHGGRLVTLDGGIPRSAVVGATEAHLVVV